MRSTKIIRRKRWRGDGIQKDNSGGGREGTRGVSYFSKLFIKYMIVNSFFGGIYKLGRNPDNDLSYF
jgi:hypothetical protein